MNELLRILPNDGELRLPVSELKTSLAAAHAAGIQAGFAAGVELGKRQGAGQLIRTAIATDCVDSDTNVTGFDMVYTIRLDKDVADSLLEASEAKQS